MLNAFTVDVEDYFQVSAFERHIDRQTWNDYPHHVVENTNRLLDLLEKKQVLGTFFILGWVADQYPRLVEAIASRGHELASHSYWHRLVYELEPESFREDLLESRRAIEAASGVVVDAYRAPSFSITRKSIWALDVLVEEGFRLDSSVFPIVHDRYGIPGAETGIHEMETKSGTIWQFPASVSRIAGVNLPISGGGYFRLYPYKMSARLLRQINTTQRRPFMFYVHPWEIDPEQPKMPFGSVKTKFRHYVNLRSTYDKLERLLDEFAFGRITDVLAQHGQVTPKPSHSTLA